MKQRCAKEALRFIPKNGVIGLGGGSTVAYLAEYVKESCPNVSVVTPSEDTKKICETLGLTVVPTESVDVVEVAFDGCDQVDRQVNAYKSAGGIHTLEKIIGRMAKEYILLVDETKVVDVINYDYPLVLEIIPKAKGYVGSMVNQMGLSYKMRTPKLMEVDIQNSKENAKDVDKALKMLTGVVETSLFYEIATKALVVTEAGFYVMERKGE